MLLQIVAGIALVSVGSIGMMLLLMIFSAGRLHNDDSQVNISHQHEQ